MNLNLKIYFIQFSLCLFLFSCGNNKQEVANEKTKEFTEYYSNKKIKTVFDGYIEMVGFVWTKSYIQI